MSTAQVFGTLPDGTPVTRYTLRHGAVEAALLDYGARLVSLTLPDREGVRTDIVLGYDTLETYVADKTYSGAVVGRVGNRIANGRFAIDGVTYTIPRNDGSNALHGGPVGFDRKVWQARETAEGLEFTVVSPDADMGFPGTLTATVRYTLDAAGLTIAYTATTDKPTLVNLTNHAYFNLAGEGTILDHEITIAAARFTPVTEALVPSGEIAPVAGTIFDFTSPRRIGDEIENPDPQMVWARGWDFNWVLGETGPMKLAAVLRDPLSGRTMTVSTTEPGLQFYSGNFMDGTMPNRSGGVYPRRGGLCLETQHFPDSANHPNFPSTILRPGETLRSVTVFGFGSR